MNSVRLALMALCCVTACEVSAQPLAQEKPAGNLDSKKNNAAKIAGLVGFVNVSCDALRTDPERFKDVIGSMGVTLTDLDQGELMLKARSYLDAYRQDIPASCKRATELFGPDGKVVPGLVLPK